MFAKEEIFNEGHRIIAVEQILRALNYMHKNKLVHRDLKTENVVYAPGPESGVKKDFSNIELKLIDFGFANINLQD